MTKEYIFINFDDLIRESVFNDTLYFKNEDDFVELICILSELNYDYTYYRAYKKIYIKKLDLTVHLKKEDSE